MRDINVRLIRQTPAAVLAFHETHYIFRPSAFFFVVVVGLVVLFVVAFVPRLFFVVLAKVCTFLFKCT